MTPGEQTALIFKGLIASLPDDQQQNVKHCIDVIQKLMADHPGGEAVVALGLIAAELQQSN